MSLLGIGASLLGGLLGGGGKSSPSQGQAVSGWQALPKEVRDVYLKQYLPGVQEEFTRPLNPAVQDVYNQYGSGIEGLLQNLPQYKQLFEQNISDPTFNQIQQDTDIQKNDLNSLAANSGMGALFNSNLGVQLSQLQNNADNRKANYAFNMNRDNTMNALSLRNQTLEEMLKSGDQGYDRLARLAGLLGAFPGGSSQTNVGAQGPQPNIWDKVAGGARAIDSLNDQGYFSGWF
jgi:hypothetical protein